MCVCIYDISSLRVNVMYCTCQFHGLPDEVWPLSEPKVSRFVRCSLRQMLVKHYNEKVCGRQRGVVVFCDDDFVLHALPSNNTQITILA